VSEGAVSTLQRILGKPTTAQSLYREGNYRIDQVEEEFGDSAEVPLPLQHLNRFASAYGLGVISRCLAGFGKPGFLSPSGIWLKILGQGKDERVMQVSDHKSFSLRITPMTGEEEAPGFNRELFKRGHIKGYKITLNELNGGSRKGTGTKQVLAVFSYRGSN